MHLTAQAEKIRARRVSHREKSVTTAIAWITCAAAIGAVALNLWQVFYSESLQPSAFSPHLAVECRLVRVGILKGREIDQVTLTAKNDSNVRVIFYSAGYKVEGEELLGSDGGTDAQFITDAQSVARSKIGASEAVSLTRYASPKLTRLLACGTLANSGDWLEPGASRTITTFIYVPQHQFDVMHGYLVALYGRNFNEKVQAASIAGPLTVLNAQFLAPSETQFHAAGAVTESQQHTIYLAQENMQQYKVGESMAQAVLVSPDSSGR